MRQKVAFVVKASLSLLLSRMTEFSPVRITRFASTVLMAASPGWFLMPMIAECSAGTISAARCLASDSLGARSSLIASLLPVNSGEHNLDGVDDLTAAALGMPAAGCGSGL